MAACTSLVRFVIYYLVYNFNGVPNSINYQYSGIAKRYSGFLLHISKLAYGICQMIFHFVKNVF